MQIALAALCLLALASPIACLDELPPSTQLTLKSMFLQQLAGQAATIPPNTVCSGCLFTSGTHQAHALKGRGTVSQMVSELERRQYPDSVVSRLRALQFAENTKFHIYTINVNSQTREGRYESFMAAGRRVSSRVEFGVIKGEAATQLIVKTVAKVREECNWFLGIKTCKDVTYYEPRPNTAEELRRIEEALRYYAQISMSKLANEFYTF